jgi:2-methylcitrate dehydratase PrpD
VLSLVPEAKPTGQRFLGAFAVGCEAQLRVGCAISPAHYDHGWHITGTCGVFGAAVAASVLLGLDAEAAARALSLAATMTAGHREAFGTMTKPLHAGKAAANGVLAARLAAVGLAGPEDILGPGGVLEVLASTVDRDALGLGWPDDHPWELELNTIKTYPCGVVAHPAMDAAIAVSAQIGETADITAITLRCNPLVPELMGRVQPEDGLGSRFSARHGVAVGLRHGRAGLAEFSDTAATDPGITRLRGLITLDPSPDVPRDAADLRIEFGDAPAISVSTEHTRGSAARPLSDAEVLDKTRALFGPVLGESAANRAWSAIGRLSEATDTSELLAALRPVSAPAEAEVSAEAEVPASAQTHAVVGADVAPEAGVGANRPTATAMTATDEILALARQAVPDVDTEAGLAGFKGAIAEGAKTTAAFALVAIRSPSSSVSSPAWTAWLWATSAAAGAWPAAETAEPSADPARSVDVPRLATCAAAEAITRSLATSGSRTSAAVAAGLEAAALVESRLPDWGGWSGPTVAAAIGAVVAAGLTLGLTEVQLRNALGIAATQAAGLRIAEFGHAEFSPPASTGDKSTRPKSTGAGPLQAGKAAFTGVEAALLARAGLTAPAEPLDGRRGLFALFGPAPKVG